MSEPIELTPSNDDLVRALARGELTGPELRRAQALLEEDRACRELFHSLTARRFPAIPSYTIVEQIGKGGFGVVYKAIHHAKERTEALKVLFSKTTLLTSYFENEVHLIARLRHANIATLFEAQLAEPPLYYTMEFVEGERLNDYLQTHDVPLPERIAMIRKIAVAIDYAHKQGVVHCDIKPQNILVGEDGEPHIVDFGIAKKLGLDPGDGGERSDGPVGTLGYISPEQVSGKGVDARADVYALGVLLYHCVTGEPAREAIHQNKVLAFLRERRVSQAEDLAAIIARCVEHEPAARYGDCKQFADDLQAYLDGRPVTARTERRWLYQLLRLLVLVLRNHPIAIRASLVTGLALLITGLAVFAGARKLQPVANADQTVIVGLQNSTKAAIARGEIGAGLPGLLPGKTVDEEMSWRMLHGRLMERLAVARPLVVVFDYYFPECYPQYDAYLLRGIAALRSVGTPVVIGANEFSVDGEPRVCAAIGEQVSGLGAIFSRNPNAITGEFDVTFAVKRGFNPPQPGLALAAYAAARFPDYLPQFEIGPSHGQLQIRYRSRGEPKPGESRWRDEADMVPLHAVLTVGVTDAVKWLFTSRGARPGDELAQVRVKADPIDYWRKRTFAYEQVLTASDRDLRSWFGNRAIIVGHMVNGEDQYPLPGGDPVFGCQVHAQALESLLSRRQMTRLDYRDVGVRAVLYCFLAGILASVTPLRGLRSFGVVNLLAIGSIVAGLFVCGFGATVVVDPLKLETLICASALLVTFGPVLWCRAVRDRQLLLAPREIRYAPREPGLASTILADTR